MLVLILFPQSMDKEASITIKAGDETYEGIIMFTGDIVESGNSYPFKVEINE